MAQELSFFRGKEIHQTLGHIPFLAVADSLDKTDIFVMNVCKDVGCDEEED